MIKKYFALSLVAASVVVAGCSSDDKDTDVPVVVVPAADSTNDSSAYDLIANSTDHTQFLAAIAAASLADQLDNPANEYTIFAPDDAAFAALDTAEAGAVAALLADVAEVTRYVQYHVVSGTQDDTTISTAITDAGGADFTLASLLVGEGEDGTLTFTNPAAGLSVNGDTVIGTSTAPAGEGATGAMYTLAGVLTPPEVEVTNPGTTDPVTGESGPVLAEMEADADGFTKVLAALGSNTIKLDEDDGTQDPWNIFAPTDAALGAADVALGDMVFVGARKLPADLIADTTVTTFDGSKTYAIGGTDAGSLTIGGAPAILLGGGTSVTYKLTAVPVAN